MFPFLGCNRFRFFRRLYPLDTNLEHYGWRCVLVRLAVCLILLLAGVQWFPLVLALLVAGWKRHTGKAFATFDWPPNGKWRAR